MGREASGGYARVGSGRAASAAPQPPGSGPSWAPLLQPLSNPHDGGGGRFRAAPSSPERTQPVPFHKHPGKQMQGKWASSLGPHCHGQPLPRGLCISLPRFSIALATSARTGVSTWGTQAPHWPTRVAWAAVRRAWAVCAVLKESRSLGDPVAFVLGTASAQTSPACPSQVTSRSEGALEII